METNYEKKYLKYKQKYLNLKNSKINNENQEGGVLIPGIYFIFYSNGNTDCAVTGYQHGETFPNIAELNTILGPTTYSLPNKSNDLTQISIEGVVYKNLLKNFDIKKYLPFIQKKLENKKMEGVTPGMITQIYDNLTFKISDFNKISIDTGRLFGLFTYKLKPEFFNDNDEKIQNIMMDLNSRLASLKKENIMKNPINSILILDVGTGRNSYIGSKIYSHQLNLKIIEKFKNTSDSNSAFSNSSIPNIDTNSLYLASLTANGDITGTQALQNQLIFGNNKTITGQVLQYQVLQSQMATNGTSGPSGTNFELTGTPYDFVLIFIGIFILMYMAIVVGIDAGSELYKSRQKKFQCKYIKKNNNS